MKQYITKAENGFVDASWLKGIKDSLNGGKVLFHIYTGISDREVLIALMNTLREAIPSCNVVGTESGGEIREGSLMDKGILISCLVFESTEISVRIYDGLAGQERLIGSRIKEEIDGEVLHDLKAAELLLPGALLNTLDMYEELKHCDPSVVIFGGYAGNHDADLENAFVMADGKTYTNACVAILYYGKDFRIDAAKSAGWEKLGMPFKITSAEGNLLREINGIPAADIYQRYLNIAVDEDFIENTNEFPIAAYVGDEEILRHTNTVMEDGSLLLAGSVLEGWDMYLTFGNPTGIIDEVNRRLKQIHAFNPQAILLYSCYVRKLFWERFVNVELVLSFFRNTLFALIASERAADGDGCLIAVVAAGVFVALGGMMVLHAQSGIRGQPRAWEVEGVLHAASNLVLGSRQVAVFPIEESLHRGRLLLLVAGCDEGTVDIGSAGAFLVGCIDTERPYAVTSQQVMGA
ncbi:MAG: FIST C-terminal domain-containing protein, partial [Solobacterium sp.]|nr:FIST C-terminal domain-containing protein [Solobacterium sp.]